MNHFKDMKLRIVAVALLAVIAGTFAVAVVDSLAARRDVDGQMSELRAASTRRIDILNKTLEQEQAEGDRAEAKAARYLQQLCDNEVAPYEGACK